MSKKIDKYPLKKKTKHVNVLDDGSKSPYVFLSHVNSYKDVQYYNTRMHNDYIIN